MSMLEPAKLTTFFFFPLKTQTPAKTPFSKTFTSAVGIIRDKELLKSLVFLSQPLYICIKHSKSNTPFRHPSHHAFRLLFGCSWVPSHIWRLRGK